MNLEAFFDTVRASLGRIREASVVQGYEAIIAAAKSRDVALWYLAYMLATVFHETAGTMQPIAEYGKGRGREYGKPAGKYGKIYYGRGYVQLTWLFNYEKATAYFRNVLGKDVDFVRYPGGVMVPEYAAIIMFVGMAEGWFTGKDLDDYIDNIDESDAEDLREFTNARRIINGTDKAAKIGGYALVFEKALKAAGYNTADFVKAPASVPSKADVEYALAQPKANRGAIAQGGLGALALIVITVVLKAIGVL